MSVQYTILSILIRPEIQERISVGLIMFNDNEILFSYSRNKLRASKTLISASAHKIVTDTLESIENKIKYNESDYFEKYGFTIFKNRSFDDTFSTSYISYLNRYSNNLLTFTSPKEISISINYSDFKILFTKYVDEIIDKEENVQKLNPFQLIKNKYGQKLFTHFDLNSEITPVEVPNLIVPVKVDFSGTNDIDVYAQTVDMKAIPQTIINHINSFIHLKTSYKENNVGIKEFVIASEPEKSKYGKQHAIWRQLKESSILNYLDLSETQELVDYAELHQVIPRSKSES